MDRNTSLVCLYIPAVHERKVEQAQERERDVEHLEAQERERKKEKLSNHRRERERSGASTGKHENCGAGKGW